MTTLPTCDTATSCTPEAKVRFPYLLWDRIANRHVHRGIDDQRFTINLSPHLARSRSATSLPVSKLQRGSSEEVPTGLQSCAGSSRLPRLHLVSAFLASIFFRFWRFCRSHRILCSVNLSAFSSGNFTQSGLWNCNDITQFFCFV